MSAHTPGPWAVGQTLRDCIDIDSPSRALATVEVYDDDPEAEANALLIAAAPDLLDACRTAVAQLNAIMGALGEYTNTGDVEVAKILDKAIAKATGEGR